VTDGAPEVHSQRPGHPPNLVVTVGGVQSNLVYFVVTSISSGGPAPPSNLSATVVSSSQINLSWTASSTPGVTYTVLRNGSQRATGITVTSYSDTGLSPGTIYHYQVEAVNSSGTSEPSNTVVPITQGGAPPLPPGALTAAALSPTEVRLDWAPSLTAGVTYTVYNSVPLPIADTGETTYLVEGLSPNTSTCYTVTAVLNGVQSSMSNQACAMTPPASCPSVNDTSTALGPPDQNGNTVYDLSVKVTDQNGSMTYDYGSNNIAFGIPGVEFLDCNGNLQPASYTYRQGLKHFSTDVQQVNGTAGFLWKLDAWDLGEPFPCNPDDPNPEGVTYFPISIPQIVGPFHPPCP
jgi:hypothetical protein